MFGDQIGGKRQQEQQDDLRGGLVTAPAAEEAHRAAIRPAHHKPGQHAANRHFQKLDGGAADGKDHRAHRHRDGKLERDQAGGVVHQRLTLQNTHDFFRYPPFPDDTRERHGIGRRQHGRQRERRDQRNARHNPVDQKADADHRYDHQRQRQAEDLAPVLNEFASWRFPAVGEQQRRDKQDQKQLWIKFNMQTKGRPRQKRANGDLHQWEWNLKGQYARHYPGE